MHDAFSARQFVSLAGTVDAGSGVVQESTGSRSHSGSRVAVLAETEDGFEVLVGAAENRHALTSILRHDGELRGLALSSDGRFLAVAARGAGAASRWRLQLLSLDGSGEASSIAAEPR